ncbi:MAG: SAM-dependent methyltransferase [Jatrophihabitans sp.]|uniref:SAM-dependent methyltransferase n=1 Tax=Jatrophihabitans sp. TaxID=1932789 RepID=UPI003F7E797A
MRLIPRELHRSQRPSSTAEAVTLARAAELRRPVGDRIVTDEYAPHFLSGPARVVERSLGVTGGAYRALERLAPAGVITFSLVRHRFIDVHLARCLDDGVEQVLVLGAGYDSRAYRFAAELSGRPVHEVDLPPLSRRKAAIVAAHPEVFGHTRVRRVEIDFRTQSLAERLLESGFAVGARTFVVWEGVTPYLDRPAVEGTLATLGDVCGQGSTLTLDFWQRLPAVTTGGRLREAAARSFALIGEPLTFAVTPDDAAKLLGSHGFTVADLADHRELESRYSTGGRASEASTYVVAARKR